MQKIILKKLAQFPKSAYLCIANEKNGIPPLFSAHCLVV